MQGVVVRSLTKTWGETAAVGDVIHRLARSARRPPRTIRLTTLRLVAGLDEPTAGTIEISGKDVRGLTGAARGVAMVFQS